MWLFWWGIFTTSSLGTFNWAASATTLVSLRNTRVFRTALMALIEPPTLWWWNIRYQLPSRRVVLHTYLLDFAPGMWWHIRNNWMTHVLHSSQGLQLRCSRFHNAWWCLCLSLADSQMIPLCYCYISDAALSPNMFSFKILSLIPIQSSVRIHRLQLHLIRHHHILQVWNIQSNLHTL